MLDMIASQNIPTALFCASDAIAMGALRALHEKNYRVPEDISILGFNNNQNTAYTNPPLTTIHAPARQMGELAAQFITQFVAKGKNPSDSDHASVFADPASVLHGPRVKK